MENGKYTRDELAWMFFNRHFVERIGTYYNYDTEVAILDSFKAADLFLEESSKK